MGIPVLVEHWRHPTPLATVCLPSMQAGATTMPYQFHTPAVLQCIDLSSQPQSCVGEAYGVAFEVSNLGRPGGHKVGPIKVTAVYAGTVLADADDVSIWVRRRPTTMSSALPVSALDIKDGHFDNKAVGSVGGDEGEEDSEWVLVCKDGCLDESGSISAPATRISIDEDRSPAIEPGQSRTFYIHSPSTKLCLG